MNSCTIFAQKEIKLYQNLQLSHRTSFNIDCNYPKLSKQLVKIVNNHSESNQRKKSRGIYNSLSKANTNKIKDEKSQEKSQNSQKTFRYLKPMLATVRKNTFVANRQFLQKQHNQKQQIPKKIHKNKVNLSTTSTNNAKIKVNFIYTNNYQSNNQHLKYHEQNSKYQKNLQSQFNYFHLQSTKIIPPQQQNKNVKFNYNQHPNCNFELHETQKKPLATIRNRIIKNLNQINTVQTKYERGISPDKIEQSFIIYQGSKNITTQSKDSENSLVQKKLCYQSHENEQLCSSKCDLKSKVQFQDYLSNKNLSHTAENTTSKQYHVKIDLILIRKSSHQIALVRDRTGTMGIFTLLSTTKDINLYMNDKVSNVMQLWSFKNNQWAIFQPYEYTISELIKMKKINMKNYQQLGKNLSRIIFQILTQMTRKKLNGQKINNEPKKRQNKIRYELLINNTFYVHSVFKFLPFFSESNQIEQYSKIQEKVLNILFNTLTEKNFEINVIDASK